MKREDFLATPFKFLSFLSHSTPFEILFEEDEISSFSPREAFVVRSTSNLVFEINLATLF